MSWFHRHEVGHRADVARMVVWAVFGVLVLAFFRVQVLASSHYRLESEENRLRPVRLVAPRGLITDRNGLVLADNIPGYSIAVTGQTSDAVRTTLEAIELSTEPVAFTHANPRSYHHHRRNKTDEALKLLAERGGVVGATCIRSFLRNGYDSTIEDYVDAIDNLVEMVGIYHVAIGTDYTQDQPESFWRYSASTPSSSAA